MISLKNTAPLAFNPQRVCVCSLRTTTLCSLRTRRMQMVTPRLSTWLSDTWLPAKRTRRSDEQLVIKAKFIPNRHTEAFLAVFLYLETTLASILI